MTKPHLDAAFLATGVSAVKDNGLGSVHADGTSLFLVEFLALQLQLRQLLCDSNAFVLRHLSRLALCVQDDVHLLLDGFPTLAFLPTRAAVAARVLVMTRVELNVRRRILTEAASLQFCSEGLPEEADDLLWRPGRVGDVDGAVAFVVSVAHFETFLNSKLQTRRLAILHGAMKDCLTVVALGVDLGAVGEQIFEGRYVVAERGIGQRGGAFIVAVVDFDAVTDREVDAVDVASSRRMVEDRLTHVTAAQEFCAMPDEVFHELFTFGPVARGMQCGVAPRLTKVEVRVKRRQHAHHVETVVPTRVVQRTDPVLVQDVHVHASENEIDDFPSVAGDRGVDQLLG